MNRFMRTFHFFIVALLCATCVFAENPTDQPGDPTPRLALYESETHRGKIAYIDMARLFNGHPATAPAIRILQKEMGLKMAERQPLTDELESLSSEGGRDAIEAQWQKIKQYDQQVQSMFDARQAEVFTPVFELIEASVREFGANNGYRAIFVEPRDEAEDVTDQVLRTLK